MKFNFRVEILLLVIILILLLVAPMLLSCTNHSPYKLLEGFVEGFVEGVAKTLNDEKDEKKDINKKIEALTNRRKKEGFSNHFSKHKSDIPLIFNETPFSPQCCPTTYSNSMGCACMTMPQYSYLIERGGNNVPFSQY